MLSVSLTPKASLFQVIELLNFNIEGLNDETIELLQPYIGMEDFSPEEAVAEMKKGNLDDSIAKGLCVWVLFAQAHRKRVREFANEAMHKAAVRKLGYMRRLERLAGEDLAAGQHRFAEATSAVAAAQAELAAAEHSLLELLGEDEAALLRAKQEKKKQNIRGWRNAAHTAEGLAQLQIAAAEKARKREEKERLRVLWDELDADGSGDLDREEVRSVMKKMGRNVSEAKLDRIMVDMDRNGDGLVDYDEFVNWWDENEKRKDDDDGWSFHADLDTPTSAYQIELYERAVLLKNQGQWAESLRLFDQYRRALTDALANTDKLAPVERTVEPGQEPEPPQPQEPEEVGRGDALLQRAPPPAAPTRVDWQGLVELPKGAEDSFGLHRHLRSTPPPAAIRSRAPLSGPPTGEADALARRLLGQTSEFWDTQALKQECRRKYGSTGPEISAPS